MSDYICNACGQHNKEGTTICSSCGKPLDHEQSTKLLNMRYDGTAIRSKTRNRSIVDKVWNFFSSIKVGVTLIAIALIASAIGTIYPQEMYIPATVEPLEHYRDQYGISGQIYYQLGFHELYSSWWYMLIIGMIGISIFIVSLDRGIPLYKALKYQKVKRHQKFLTRQKLFREYENVSNQDKKTFVQNLKKRRYRIREDNGHILAEKGRFSRWGPYVNHTGLIIFLIGTLLRFLPFMHVDDMLWVREGETAVIPHTNQEYYLENNNFTVEFYGESEEDAKYEESLENVNQPIPKHFQTDAVIYRDTSMVTGADPELKKVKKGKIVLNEPMSINGLTLYQNSYQLNEFQSMSFNLHKKDDQSEESIGSFTVDLTEPKKRYTFDNGFEILLDEYFPEYEIVDGEPESVSNYPRNPGFVFLVYPPDSEEPEVSFLSIGRNIDPTNENQYKLSLADFEVRNVTGLSVKKDYTLPIVGLGAIIFMIGVVQGMYWHHRRIWIHPDDNRLLVAAHTNKNWFGLRKEFEKSIDHTNFSMIVDQEEEKEDNQ